MYRNFAIITATVLTASTSASAFEFTGGSFGAEYTTYQDTDDLSATGINSDVEFAINPQFSVALSLSSTTYDINAPFDLSSSSRLLHGIYNINDAIKVGAFYGNESVIYYSSDTYGLEAAFDNGTFDVGGYLGKSDLVDTDVTIAGLNGGYKFGAGFGINADVERVEVDDIDYTLTTSSIGLEYGFGNGAAVSIEAGQFKLESDFFSDDQNFVTVGASFGFGPNGGVSFESPNAINSIFFFGPV